MTVIGPASWFLKQIDKDSDGEIDQREALSALDGYDGVLENNKVAVNTEEKENFFRVASCFGIDSATMSNILNCANGMGPKSVERPLPENDPTYNFPLWFDFCDAEVAIATESSTEAIMFKVDVGNTLHFNFDGTSKFSMTFTSVEGEEPVTISSDQTRGLTGALLGMLGHIDHAEPIIERLLNMK